MDFYFNYAYDATAWEASSDVVDRYLAAWAGREFGQHVADRTADLVARYSVLVSIQKPELLAPDTYSLIDYRE